MEKGNDVKRSTRHKTGFIIILLLWMEHGYKYTRKLVGCVILMIPRTSSPLFKKEPE